MKMVAVVVAFDVAVVAFDVGGRDFRRRGCHHHHHPADKNPWREGVTPWDDV